MLFQVVIYYYQHPWYLVFILSKIACILPVSVPHDSSLFLHDLSLFLPVRFISVSSRFSSWIKSAYHCFCPYRSSVETNIFVSAQLVWMYFCMAKSTLYYSFEDFITWNLVIASKLFCFFGRLHLSVCRYCVVVKCSTFFMIYKDIVFQNMEESQFIYISSFCLP